MSWSQPQLKRGVDLQLQTAFDDGQWASVIRLAEKRLRTFNDPYFEIVKICAESQLDAPSDKASALIALEKYVKEGTVLKDADGIDLLEWAVGSLQDEREFHRTLGILRVRLVKACPKDRNSGIRCLESCLLHWDLVSAQQIAAILDRSFPHERTHFYWNVVITYSLSLSDQCPADKKSLYGTLALKQIQRAAQTASAATDGDADRSIRTEEEILLYFRILETHGSAEDWQAALNDPHLGPVKQFRLGRKDLLLRALDVCTQRDEWQTVYKLSKDCLVGPDGSPQINLLACDWSIWQHFLNAANHLRATQLDIVDEVADTLSAFSSGTTLRPIYLRNILLARVSAAFQLGGTTSCEEELQHYVESQCSSPACFDDIRTFVEQLDISATKSLAYDFVPQLASRQKDPLHIATIKTLAYQLQYLALTVPGHIVPDINESAGEPARWKCVLSNANSSSPSCPERFTTLAESTASLYRALVDTLKLTEGSEPDCVPELAILTATALSRLSGLGEDSDTYLTPMQSVKLDKLLQATLVLEHQLSRTPKHTRVTLLLLRIYLVLGCITRARDLWSTMDVKRTIIDSLSPYFLDRLSTLSPAAVVPVPQRPEKSLTYPLKAYYLHSLRLRMPRRLADAFEAESLTSILEIPRFIERLRKSCTLVMSQLEERRALRALGHRPTPLDQEDLLSDILSHDQLSESIDYGSVPHLDATRARPIHDILRIGPGPSNARSQLGLVTELFFELLQHKQPTSLKPASIGQAATADHFVVLEALQQLGDSASDYLHSARGILTPPEQGYFELIGLLMSLISISTTTQRTPASTVAASQVADAVGASLDILYTSASATPQKPREPVTKLVFGSMHSLFHVRDSAAATRLACAYITSFNDLQKSRDKTGKTCVPKEVLAAVKSLDMAAAKALNEGKAQVGLLKKDFGSGPLDGRIRGWAFVHGDDTRLTKDIREIGRDSWQSWAAVLAESYRSTVKGWELVKWE